VNEPKVAESRSVLQDVLICAIGVAVAMEGCQSVASGQTEQTAHSGVPIHMGASMSRDIVRDLCQP